MKTTFFGIEIEMSGITRAQAAETVANYLNGQIARTYNAYDSYTVVTVKNRP